MLHDTVLDTIARHAMFAPGDKVAVAVSGGADSVCLLHLLHELAPHWNLHLSVAHIDHGIRGPASQADAEFVRGLAHTFALPFHFRKVDVPAINDNLEQAAREVRLDFFHDLKTTETAALIATGHTRSDQAETVLFRILRGAGLTGLSGIRPKTSEGLVRPLLDCTARDVRQWLRERNIPWREDETNQDSSLDRNRIRHNLIPQLQREYNPQIEAALAHLAGLARDNEELLSSTTATNDRRMIREAIQAVKGDLRQIDFEHVEAILKLARSRKGHGRTQLPGIEAVRSFDSIQIRRAGTPGTDVSAYTIAVNPPNTVVVPVAGGQIDFQLVEGSDSYKRKEPYDNLVEELDWQQITSRSATGLDALTLRNWKPGDCYRRLGRPYDQKLKFLFQEARIPLWERRGWPVLTANESIVWCRGFGVAAGFVPSPSSRTILRIKDTNRTNL